MDANGVESSRAKFRPESRPKIEEKKPEPQKQPEPEAQAAAVVRVSSSREIPKDEAQSSQKIGAQTDTSVEEVKRQENADQVKQVDVEA